MCPQFSTEKISIETWSRVSTTVFLNSKNVYFAQYAGKRVVLKKLGHNYELGKLDNQILKLSESRMSGLKRDVSFAIRELTHRYIAKEYIPDVQGTSGKTVLHLTFESNLTQRTPPTGSDMLVCPSQRKFNVIENQFIENNKGANRLGALYNIMTLLILNSEPLLFQAFPSEDGWPFPRYLGAC